MEIYLVQPPVGGFKHDCSPPVGLLALASTLKADGHDPHLVDLNLSSKNDELDARKSLRTQFVQALPKRQSRVGLIGVSTWSYNFDITMEFIEAIKKKHPQAPIVAGGPHATFVDREMLNEFKEIDFVLRDEGDYTFPRLVRAIEQGAKPNELALIPGLTWRRAGEVVRNLSGPVIEDMDALPYPLYDLIDVRDYLAHAPILHIEAGRGCPYNCNFCSTTNMFQRKYRVKAPGRLLDEVEWLKKKTGHSRFELLHDNLVASKKYVLELCSEIKRRRLDVSWSCTSRTDNMDEELAEAMFLAGCVTIFYGVESYNEQRQHWTGKKLKPPLADRAIEITGRYHMTPGVGIIVGFPDETQAELDATLAAAIRWTADPGIRAEISTAALRFYPGADLFGHANLLRYDPVAARNARILAGFELRTEWRTLPRVFPLSCIHTPPDETRRNIAHRDFTRTLLKNCPQTLRAAVELGKIPPSELYRRMLEGRTFRFLDEYPEADLVLNETIRAFAQVVVATGDPVLRELLSAEVPFWETTPVVGILERLEHIVHPSRYDHATLLDFVAHKTDAPREVAGQKILSVRSGRECVVWFTPEPEKMITKLEQSYAVDRVGTMQFLMGLGRS